MTTPDYQHDLVRRIIETNREIMRSAVMAHPEIMDLDLTMPQLKVIMLLHVAGDLRAGAVAERLGVHISTASGLLDRLAAARLIRRVEDPDDRRLVISRLTPRGRDIVERIQGSAHECMEQRLRSLTNDELEALATGLSALLRAYRAELPPDSTAPPHQPGVGPLAS
jgi:DNA-binding MarR family transcriptional regulator